MTTPPEPEINNGGAMNYIDEAMDAMRAALPGQPDDLLRLYALLALRRGENTSMVDIHDAWAVWRHETDPGHRAIVRFNNLAPEVQELDRPYMEAVREVGRQLAASRWNAS